MTPAELAVDRTTTAIEQTAAEWHAMSRCGPVPFMMVIIAAKFGFLDGFQRKPWRPRRKHYVLAAWQAGWLARWMHDHDAKAPPRG